MDQIKQNLKKLLREFHDTIGVTGNEQEVIKLVYSELKDHCDELRVTTTGNIIATKKGNRPGHAVLVGAHLDEVGFVVRSILPNGYIQIDKIGGIPDNILLSRSVLVSEKRIPGVIGSKPGHLQTPDEAKSVQPVSRCYVDVGAQSDTEAKSWGIKIGDPVVFRTEFIEMQNPDLICSRAIDDRINCAVIIELFKTLKADDFAGTLYGVFTVREEAGLFGARTVGHGMDIDYAIALDTVPAGDTPDINTVAQLPIWLGKGPAMPISDGVGPTFFQFIHPGVRRFIEQKAADCKINLQPCTILGYAYATDASAFSYLNGGIPTATLAVPRRYSHSPVEVMHLGDAADVFHLMLAVIKDHEKADLSFVHLD